MFNALLFLAVSTISIGVFEEVVAPTAKAAVGYTTEAVDWAKDKVTSE